MTNLPRVPRKNIQKNRNKATHLNKKNTWIQTISFFYVWDKRPNNASLSVRMVTTITIIIITNGFSTTATKKENKKKCRHLLLLAKPGIPWLWQKLNHQHWMSPFYPFCTTIYGSFVQSLRNQTPTTQKFLTTKKNQIKAVSVIRPKETHRQKKKNCCFTEWCDLLSFYFIWRDESSKKKHFTEYTDDIKCINWICREAKKKAARSSVVYMCAVMIPDVSPGIYDTIKSSLLNCDAQLSDSIKINF